MKKKRLTIDGFIPRRSGNELGKFHDRKSFEDSIDDVRPELHTGEDSSRLLGKSDGSMLGRLDIDESLDEIDSSSKIEKPNKKQKRRKVKLLSERSIRKRKIIKRVLIILLVILLGFGAYFVTKLFLAQGNIFQGSIFDLIQHEPLKQDSNGRSNFLIVGTSEDDPGHPGAYLTDSIMVLSLDQKNKNAYMFSVPRDLYVDYGMACNSGYQGKINEYFLCTNGDLKSSTAEQDRLTKTQKFVGDIFGLDIQYGVHVNYTVMRDVVKALGNSITVTIESRDPRGQMDANFDWKCGASYSEHINRCPPNGHFIDYPNGPVTLDAEHALYLAQARGDTYNYGFEQSNFDREKNQQKILIAIRDKAMSTGTLANLGAVTNLIDALGNNLRTNVRTSEIRTLVEVAGAIKNEDIHRVSLVDGDNPVMSDSGNPSAGLYSYDEIRKFISDTLSNDPVIRERAGIVILNGTKVSGVAQIEADKLTEKKYTINLVGDAPKGTYGKYEIYVVDATKTGTLDALKTIYPDATIKTTEPPVSVTEKTDFVLVIGSAE